MVSEYSLKGLLIRVPQVDEKGASPITLKKHIPGCHHDLKSEEGTFRVVSQQKKMGSRRIAFLRDSDKWDDDAPL